MGRGEKGGGGVEEEVIEIENSQFGGVYFFFLNKGKSFLEMLDHKICMEHEMSPDSETTFLGYSLHGFFK